LIRAIEETNQVARSSFRRSGHGDSPGRTHKFKYERSQKHEKDRDSQRGIIGIDPGSVRRGWAYFYNDYIAGDVDFIWGYPYAPMFDHSELHTIYNVTSTSPTGYVVQSRAYSGYANTSTGTFITTPGFVIANSKLTADSNVQTGTAFLARSGGAGVGCAMPGASTAQGTNCDSVAYVNDQIGTHISTGGWLGSAEGATGSALSVSPATGQTEMIGWREWGSMDSTGNTLGLAGRDTSVATYTVPLTGTSAATDLSSPTAVFAGWNNGAGWTPTP
jgi:hypothetical protein